MVAMRLANSLVQPTGTPDMVVDGSGIASATTATMGVTSLPAWLEAGYHMIRVIDGINDEIMRATITPGSTTIGIERAFENAAQLPATSHAAAASVYLIDSKASWEQYFAEHGQPGGFQYLGYNVVGASVEAVSDKRVYLKQVVLPVDGLLASIGPNIVQTTDNAFGLVPVVMTDNAGAPGSVIFSPPPMSAGASDTSFGIVLETSATPTYGPSRWVHVPVAQWLPAGTYWVGVLFLAPSGTLNLAYDSGGSDHYYTSGGYWVADEGRYSETTGSKNYSIRAGFLTPGGGAGAGSLVLLEQHDAAASATLDFTSFITPLYDEYLFEMVGVAPATDNVALRVEVSSDGGATWDTTAGHYQWGNAGVKVSTGASDIQRSASDTAFSMMVALGNAASRSISGSFRLFAPLDTTLQKMYSGSISSVITDGGLYLYVIGGTYTQTAAINAIRFLMASGNIASGTIRVYGVAKGPVPNPGGIVKLASIQPTGTSVDFTNIPQGYKALKIVWQAQGNGGAVAITAQVNGDSGANYIVGSSFVRYDGAFIGNVESGGQTAFNVGGLGPLSETYPNSGEIILPNYSGTVLRKTLNAFGSHFDGTRLYRFNGDGWWNNTAAINRITISAGGGVSFEAGSTFDLYGLS